jgi:hypothetical protein
MCAVFKVKGIEFRPGREVHADGPGGAVRAVWAGFARSEILHWWISKGGVPIDIRAEEFAERSEADGSLVWRAVPEGFAIRGLLDTQSGGALVKIVTRAATPEEFAHFQHPRHPVLEAPLHAETPAPPPEARPAAVAAEKPGEWLFGATPAVQAQPRPRARKTPAKTPAAVSEVQELLFDF